MTRKTHMVAIMLAIVPLAALILLAILIANGWLNARPIVDMRL